MQKFSESGLKGFSIYQIKNYFILNKLCICAKYRYDNERKETTDTFSILKQIKRRNMILKTFSTKVITNAENKPSTSERQFSIFYLDSKAKIISYNYESFKNFKSFLKFSLMFEKLKSVLMDVFCLSFAVQRIKNIIYFCQK